MSIRRLLATAVAMTAGAAGLRAVTPDPGAVAGERRQCAAGVQGAVERQPAELRTFLLETSVLERLSGPLCDAVVGRTDSQQLLESVERRNLFLAPLDAERRWWRYHHLFADLLRANLLRLHPARVPELHRAAASWYEQHALPGAYFELRLDLHRFEIRLLGDDLVPVLRHLDSRSEHAPETHVPGEQVQTDRLPIR